MEKISGIQEKWMKEENRTFSVYPGLPKQANGASMMGEEETWLELAQFVKDDLQWLLSIDHNKFWSHMIYSNSAHKLLVSFLKRAPPNHLKNEYLVSEEIANVFKDIERLVFLVFLRLATEKESESNYVKNLGQILYNQYLFTVPIILDICSIYGISNRELVKKLIKKILTLSPDFMEDFHEIPPHFVQVFKIVQKKFLGEPGPGLKTQSGLNSNEVRDLMFYLHDSVATVQIFLDLCPEGRNIFARCDILSEIVSFYSNVLPEIEKVLKDSQTNVHLMDLLENCRLDLLRIVKTIFDCLLDEPNEMGKSKEEAIDEYLTFMTELLPEPLFLTDFNIMYSIEVDLQTLLQDSSSLDTIKLNHILEGLSIAARTEKRRNVKGPSEVKDVEGDEVKLNSLITEIKDIFPHLDESFITQCLRYYDYNTERVIAAILENSVPSDLSRKTPKEERRASFDQNPISNAGRGKQSALYEDFTEVLDDRQAVNEIKDRFAEFGLIADEMYDDEYDDTYDENIAVALTEADDVEKQRRPFVVPRVLRPQKEVEENEEEEEEEEVEESGKKDWFVQNPAEIRERNARRREERMQRDVVGGAKGQGQSKQVLRNREFKGAHKSFIGNHNRKKQANRKMNQGMIPS